MVLVYFQYNNTYCLDQYYKTSWDTLSEAKQRCFENPECSMFWDECANGIFWYCHKDAKIELYDKCRNKTTLYSKGNCKQHKILTDALFDIFIVILEFSINQYLHNFRIHYNIQECQHNCDDNNSHLHRNN